MPDESRPRAASRTAEPIRLPLGIGGFPLGFQVLAGIGGLLALLALAIGVAVALIMGLKHDAVRVTDRQVQYATAIHSAALNAKAIANHERGFLMSGNPQFAEQIRVDIAKARAGFATASIAARSRVEADAVSAAHAGFELWLEAVHADLATFRSGARQRAIETSLGPTRELRHEYETSLARAQALGASALASASSSVSATSSRSVAILLAYLAVALAIGVALVLWLVRTILRPVYALLQLFTEVREMQTTA